MVLLNDFSFTRVIEIPAISNIGGLAVLWDDTLLALSDANTTDQEIHTIVKVRTLNDSFLLSCIYASNFRWKRRLLWESLQCVKNNFNGKWIVGRDSNDLLHHSGKKVVERSTSLAHLTF